LITQLPADAADAGAGFGVQRTAEAETTERLCAFVCVFAL
jgi:hypothetical protein